MDVDELDIDEILLLVMNLDERWKAAVVSEECYYFSHDDSAPVKVLFDEYFALVDRSKAQFEVNELKVWEVAHCMLASAATTSRAVPQHRSTSVVVCCGKNSRKGTRYI